MRKVSTKTVAAQMDGNRSELYETGSYNSVGNVRPFGGVGTLFASTNVIS